MKNFIFPLSILLFFACSSKSENTALTDFSNITISLDTVMVDAGDEIINLKNGLWISAIDPTATYLYNWDQDNAVLEKINLDKLTLEDKLSYEKEGPNGVGAYVSWMSLIEDDQIVFSNFEDIGIFNQQAGKLRTVKLQREQFEGDSLHEHESINRRAILANGGNNIYGILGNWTGKDFTFGKVDLDKKTLKKHPLPDFEKLADYTVLIRSSDMIMISAPEQSVDQINNKIIISNSVFNALMVYDLTIDSLYRVDYQTTLTKTSKTGTYRTEVESEKEFHQIMNEMNGEINFKKPIWDSKNQRFYRFSFENYSRDTPLEEGEKPKQKVYLTIFDRDFNVLGESHVKELDNVPNMHFVKDGKIWLYHNIDDELAFVRLSII